MNEDDDGWRWDKKRKLFVIRNKKGRVIKEKADDWKSRVYGMGPKKKRPN